MCLILPGHCVYNENINLISIETYSHNARIKFILGTSGAGKLIQLIYSIKETWHFHSHTFRQISSYYFSSFFFPSFLIIEP